MSNGSPNYPADFCTLGCQQVVDFILCELKVEVMRVMSMRYFFFIASALFVILVGCEPKEKKEEDLAIRSHANLTEGLAFLERNASRPDVATTASGLQYRIIKVGDGSIPSDDSTVEVHYVGRFLDGREFDSSIKRGIPAQFGVKQVITGWTEALKMMPEGSKWELFIPANLAYGSVGQGPIGPNATLVFEVELLNANSH